MKFSRIIACLVLVSLMAVEPIFAQDEDESEGRQILRRAALHAARMNGFTVDFEVDVDMHVDDDTNKFMTDYTVAYRRPLESSIHMNNRYSEVFFYGTESTTTRYVVEFEQVQVEEKMTLPFNIVRGASNQVSLPAIAVFGELVKEYPFSATFSEERTVDVIGAEEVNGVMCDRIRFDYADFITDVWVQQGDDALVHKVVPDLTPVKESIRERGGDVKSYDVALTVLHWQPNKVTDESLTYQPIEGVEKVAKFYRPQPAAPAESLKGKAAPAITLTQFDGQAFDLASKKGNEIVVLDFWATWCGPCRLGMPILHKVTKEFADKDVRLYAINLQETEDQVKAFLESTGLQDLTVVMDKNGDTSQPYMAESIPLMMMIGKDGVVKNVHVGVTPTYEDDIRKELEALVAE